MVCQLTLEECSLRNIKGQLVNKSQTRHGPIQQSKLPIQKFQFPNFRLECASI